MGRAGNSCPRGRTLRRRAGSTPPRHRRRTGPAAVETWPCVVVECVVEAEGGAQSKDTWDETRPWWSGREISKETAEVQINAGRSVAVAGRGIHRR
jgi:hypothetical protein